MAVQLAAYYVFCLSQIEPDDQSYPWVMGENDTSSSKFWGCYLSDKTPEMVLPRYPSHSVGCDAGVDSEPETTVPQQTAPVKRR